jgi:hypothetical protein
MTRAQIRDTLDREHRLRAHTCPHCGAVGGDRPLGRALAWLLVSAAAAFVVVFLVGSNLGLPRPLLVAALAAGAAIFVAAVVIPLLPVTRLVCRECGRAWDPRARA